MFNDISIELFLIIIVFEFSEFIIKIIKNIVQIRELRLYGCVSCFK